MIGFKVLCLLTLQAAYTAYAILIRSFASIKDQIFEAYNEVMMLVLMILWVLHFYVNESGFISLDMLIKIFLAQLLIIFLVSFISGIIKLCRCTLTIIIKFVKFVLALINGSGGRIRLEDDLGNHERIQNLSMTGGNSEEDNQVYDSKPEFDGDLNGDHAADD